MGKVLDKGVAYYFSQRMKNFDKMKADPLGYQRRLKTELFEGLRNTDYGRNHNIYKEDDWSHLPLQNYEDLFPYIQKAMYGAKDVLWPGKTHFFSKSSGTTQGKSKYIPLTKASLQENHYKGGKDVLGAYYNNNPNSNLYKGKHLILGGSSSISEYRSSAIIGDLSAHIINNLPFWVERRRTPNKAIALLPSWDEKMERLIQETAQEDVRILAGVPTWALSLINNILKEKQKSSLFDIWPNLEMYLHGGVHLDPFKNQFDALFQNKVNYIENYNASEGIFAIQDQNLNDGLTLLLNHGVYFEFLEWGTAAHPDALIHLDQVKEGVAYEMYISTLSGLWRYSTGDLISFTQLNPFKIIINGRTKQHINVFGEELMLSNLSEALKIVAPKYELNVVNFHLAPIFPEANILGGHEYVFEFKEKIDDIKEFVNDLDLVLQNVNSDYEAKRSKTGGIQVVKANVLRQGTVELWHRTKNKLGGQNKLPQISNNRLVLEELLALDKKMEY